MHNPLASAGALKQQATDLVVATGPSELDFRKAQHLSRRVNLLASTRVRRKELSSTKRANWSTLDEVAAWLGVSRSTISRILEEPRLRGGEKRVAHKDGVGKRHDHGTGRRRHAGAGVRHRSNPHTQSARTATLQAAS